MYTFNRIAPSRKRADTPTARKPKSNSNLKLVNGSKEGAPKRVAKVASGKGKVDIEAALLELEQMTAETETVISSLDAHVTAGEVGAAPWEG